MQRIIGRHRAHDFQLARGQDFDICPGRAAGNQSPGGAYGHGFSGRGETEGDRNCF